MHFLDKHHFLSFPTCSTEPRLILYCQLMHNPFAARLIKKPQAQIKRTVLFLRAEDCRGTFSFFSSLEIKLQSSRALLYFFDLNFISPNTGFQMEELGAHPRSVRECILGRGFPRRQMNLSGAGARRPKRRRRGGGAATVKDVLLFKRSS